MVDTTTTPDAPCADESTTKLVIGSQLDYRSITGEFEIRLEKVGVYLQPLRAPIARRLVGRGRYIQGKCGGGKWHLARAASLGRTLALRYNHGQNNRITLMHKETGEAVTTCTCRQQCCPDCEAGRARVLRRKTALVVPLHDRVMRDCGLEPAMLTFSLRDGLVATPAAAVAVFRLAWPHMRRALAVAGCGETYLRTEEFTAGEVTASGGHVHWHLVCWLPPFIDYAVMHRAWWRALALAGVDSDSGKVEVYRPQKVGFVGGRTARCVLWHERDDCGSDSDDGSRSRCGAEPCSRHTPGSVNFARVSAGSTSSAQTAADYITKAAAAQAKIAYALKGDKGRKAIVTDDDYRHTAEYYAGRYCQRRFVTSLRFWAGGKDAIGADVVPKAAFASQWEPLARSTGDWPARQEHPVGWAFKPEFNTIANVTVYMARRLL